MQAIKMAGRISYWNPRKGFGIIESKNEEGFITRWFVHVTSIVACKPDDPEAGCPVSFIAGERSALKPGHVPPAISVEVGFKPTAPTAEAVKALSKPVDASSDNGGAA